MVDLRVAEPIRPSGAGVEHGVDPATYPIEEHLRTIHQTLFELMRRIAAPKRLEPHVGVVGGMTDSSGNLTLPIHGARQGFSLYITRLTIEAATFETVSPRTPASPYTNAAFWMGIFVTENSRNPGQGELVDFLPNGSNVGLPALAEYQGTSGPLARSGQSISLKMVTGPASQRITVRYQGLYEAVEL